MAAPTPPEQPAPAPDPLSSFQLVVKKFTGFFSAGPRRFVEGGIWDGRLFMVAEYSASGIAYDVEKTSSLVSPYSATIQMNVMGKDNGSCGDDRRDVYAGHGVNQVTGVGWSTVNGALSAIDRPECYSYSPLSWEPTVYGMKLSFAFQEGKWVFTNAVATVDATDAPGLSLLFSSLFGNGISPTTRFTEPEAQALNSAWRDLVQN